MHLPAERHSLGESLHLRPRLRGQHRLLVLACSTASAFPCAALQTLSSGASRALVLAATSTSEHVESSEASLEYVVF